LGVPKQSGKSLRLRFPLSSTCRTQSTPSSLPLISRHISISLLFLFCVFLYLSIFLSFHLFIFSSFHLFIFLSFYLLILLSCYLPKTYSCS
jgi:hypothetical protein